MLVITSVAFSGNRSTSFTDNDLSKYKSGSDSQSPEKTEPAEEISDSSINNPLKQDNMQSFKRYEIPYIAYEGAARRIIIPVTFNNQITVHMLLDTGAPGMHISLRLAEKLGILDNDEAKLNILVSGLGGSVPAIYTIIDSIQVGGAEKQPLSLRPYQELYLTTLKALSEWTSWQIIRSRSILKSTYWYLKNSLRALTCRLVRTRNGGGSHSADLIQ
jgi:hypothetical protein